MSVAVYVCIKVNFLNRSIIVKKQNFLCIKINLFSFQNNQESTPAVGRRLPFLGVQVQGAGPHLLGAARHVHRLLNQPSRT